MLTDRRVCVTGDSYVAGVGDPEHLGWVGRVAARTHQAGQPWTVYVLGVRSHTTRDVAARWQAEAGGRLPPGCDGRVVVAAGVNDTTLANGAPQLATSLGAEYLALLLTAARQAAWPVLAIGPPPVADPSQTERVAELDAAFSSVCAAVGIGYVPVRNQLLQDPVWMRQVADGDGAHPAAAGYTALAELIWPPWHNWITTTAS